MTIRITQKRNPTHLLEAESLPVLLLTAEEREKARQRLLLGDGRKLVLQLPRGSVLVPGEILCTAEDVPVAVIQAQAEPVFTLRAQDPFALLRAAYHLGNRHVAMELARDYLRIKPDHVLAHLIEHLGGVACVEEIAPFLPDHGAYRNHHHEHA
ncbi:urease accessory protein UreE [Acidithiobacillus sp. AMEEHan]|uniref:urease accessory protein UreE n=1 Tax=Acidithiobacillus sp. AMEEHan TaxID=2994951 RepID=UPI0027E4A471|nr:urease accessory protein UreE [Acidithiobacillus sp. AMEEHan]